MDNIFKKFFAGARYVAGVLLVAGAMLTAENIFGQCAIINLQNMSVSAGAQKCGFTECQPSTPPKYFLMSTYAASTTASLYLYTFLAPPWLQTYNYTENDVTTEDPNSCTNSTVYSGKATFTSSEGSDDVTYSGSLNAVTGEWDSGGATAISLATADDVNGLLYNASTIPDLSTTNICTSTISGSKASGSYSDPDPSAYAVSVNTTEQTGLSQEFTDAMLMQKMMANMPSYPPDEVTNWSSGTGVAFYTIDANHFSCAGGKMKYKFYICAPPKGQKVKIKWEQVTTYPDGSSPSITKMTETLTGDGNPAGMYSSIHEVEVPSTPCSITESLYSRENQPQSSAGTSQ